MQTGRYFGQVKHAEQVRYVPREALAKTPFWIAFGVGLMDEKRVSLRAHFAGAAWLLCLSRIYRSRHYQVVTR
jgi:hypothetical protein